MFFLADARVMQGAFNKTVCACMFCTGHRPPAAGLGDCTVLECQLGYLEGWSVCHVTDRGHGERSAGHVQKNPRTPQRSKGQFCHTESFNSCRFWHPAISFIILPM